MFGVRSGIHVQSSGAFSWLSKRECTKMTIEEQLATLTTRLKDLEMQVGQLGEQTPLGATAATPGPSSTTSAIKVSVPREKRFGK